MSCWGCSARKPTAKGLASTGHPRRAKSSKSSRASCRARAPGGRRRACARPARTAARTCPASTTRSLDAGVPAERAPAALELLAHGGDGRREDVGADVRLSLGEDARHPAEAGEELDHLADRGVVDAGAQLAVGVGPGAALAEVHVGLRVERPGAHQLGHVAAARGDRLAAVQDHRGHAALEQRPGAEQACGAGADDERRERGRPDLRRRRRGGGHRGDVPRAADLALDLDLEVHQPAGVAALASVERAAHDVRLAEFGRGQAQALGRPGDEHGLVLVEPEREVGDSVAQGSTWPRTRLRARRVPWPQDA